MKEIQLTQGRVAQVDDEDYKYLTENFSWCVSGKPGNEYVTMNGNSITMHRLIMSVPDGVDIDHKDHNGFNNQKENLRACSETQNMWNMRPHKGRRFKGVHLRKDNSFYAAYIYQYGKRFHLGQYNTEVEAALAYNAAAILWRDEFACLNEVDGIDNEEFRKHILSQSVNY